MDSEFMVGMMLGSILQKEDFWAYYAEISDSDGNIGKDNFHKLVVTVATSQLDDSPLLDTIVVPLSDMVGGCTGTPFNEEKCAKIKSRLRDRFLNVVPVISNILFRLFDADGSGGISKAELCAIFAFQDPKMLIPAIFRVLDANGNGSVESMEIASFASDIILAIVSLVEALIDEIEPILEVPVKNFILSMFTGFTGGTDTLNIASTITTVVTEATNAMQGIAAPDSGSEATTITMQVMSGIMMPLAMGSSMLPGTVVASLKAFLTKFEEKAGPAGTLPIADVIRLANDTFVELVPRYVDATRIKAPLMAFLSNALPGIEFADSELDDVLASATGASRAFLKGGGLKRFLEAFFNFLDVNNDGQMSYEELTGLSEAANRLFGAQMGFMTGVPEEALAEYKLAMENFLRLLFGMFDGNSDGVLDPNDIGKVFDKICELGKAYLLLLTGAAKQALTGSIHALCNLLLLFKAKTLGGEADCITMDEVLRLLPSDTPEDEN